jgi:hypothetical protein
MKQPVVVGYRTHRQRPLLGGGSRAIVFAERAVAHQKLPLRQAPAGQS